MGVQHMVHNAACGTATEPEFGVKFTSTTKFYFHTLVLRKTKNL